MRATPEQLWQALTTPQLIRLYWVGMETRSDWKAGSAWSMRFPDGRLADAGEIVESVPPRRLVIKWRNEWKPELKEEGFSQCTFDVEAAGDAVKLTVSHGMDIPNSRFIQAVSAGWPICISNLKSFLETGDAVLKGNTRHT
jgi:uncharacterized protein YndB with AHSA1/START domain